MNTEEQKILKDYAELKAEIKRLEEKAEALNPAVLAAMEASELEEVNIDSLGKITVKSRRTWKYTAETQEKEKELKAVKKEEEQLGTAEYTEKKYVQFNTISE